MIKIRKGLFETNSSSTHSIVLEKDFEPTEEQINYLKNLKCDIKILNSVTTPQYDYDIYDNVESKLTYLYNIAVQEGYGHNGSENDFYKYFAILVENLKEICPNVSFEDPNPDEYYYIFEDSEWLFGETAFIENIVCNKNNLIKFILNGTVYNISRDYNSYDYILYEKVKSVEEKVKNSFIGVEVSG